jgi:hypothetical protein
LVVHSQVRTFAFTNISKAASKELAGEIKPLIAKELQSTTWYAPGVGPVRIDLAGFTSTVTDCGPATS